MDVHDLSAKQLKRAAAIKAQLEELNRELRAMFDVPATSRNAAKRARGMSAATKRKIAAAQRARWAKMRRSRSTSQSGKAAVKA
jgi:hypothetical protein